MITALIKRHMAQLLYPVDLTKFDAPARDPQFLALVKELQKQMRVQATGILTEDQYRRLSDAARRIDDVMIGLPPYKQVFINEERNFVTADGTLTSGPQDYPLKLSRITCRREEASCDLITAYFDREDSSGLAQLYFDDLLRNYAITAWTAEGIVAQDYAPCGTATLMINFKQQSAKIVSVPHGDSKMCHRANAGEGTSTTWTLADGFPLAWQEHLKRRNDALALVYKPASTLMYREGVGSSGSARKVTPRNGPP